MQRNELEAKTRDELRKLASEANIKGRSKMNKAALVDALATEPEPETITVTTEEMGETETDEVYVVPTESADVTDELICTLSKLNPVELAGYFKLCNGVNGNKGVTRKMRKKLRTAGRHDLARIDLRKFEDTLAQHYNAEAA